MQIAGYYGIWTAEHEQKYTVYCIAYICILRSIEKTGNRMLIQHPGSGKIFKTRTSMSNFPMHVTICIMQHRNKYNVPYSRIQFWFESELTPKRDKKGTDIENCSRRSYKYQIHITNVLIMYHV